MPYPQHIDNCSCNWTYLCLIRVGVVRAWGLRGRGGEPTLVVREEEVVVRGAKAHGA